MLEARGHSCNTPTPFFLILSRVCVRRAADLTVPVSLPLPTPQGVEELLAIEGPPEDEDDEERNRRGWTECKGLWALATRERAYVGERPHRVRCTLVG